MSLPPEPGDLHEQYGPELSRTQSPRNNIKTLLRVFLSDSASLRFIQRYSWEICW